MPSSLQLVTLCTGNVARSVMLGYMLSGLAEANGLDWRVRTAGTHVLEGSAVSPRTRDALLAIDDLGARNFTAHRSHQLTDEDVDWADAILASEADHVRYVRTSFFLGAEKTVSLQQFLREAPLDAPFVEQLHYVAALEPMEFFDVVDPAGADQTTYDTCARRLWEMAQVFTTLVAGEIL